MAFETDGTRGVSSVYGTRKLGGAQGTQPSSGIGREATVNFDGDSLPKEVSLPAGAVVTDILLDFATGSLATAEVGSVDISTADGSTSVAAPLGGDLTITGPTAGTVVVKYDFAL